MDNDRNMHHAPPRACIAHKPLAALHKSMHRSCIKPLESPMIEPIRLHNPLHKNGILAPHIMHKWGSKLTHKYAPFIHCIQEENHAIRP